MNKNRHQRREVRPYYLMRLDKAGKVKRFAAANLIGGRNGLRGNEKYRGRLGPD
jgi:hypothetical protein